MDGAAELEKIYRQKATPIRATLAACLGDASWRPLTSSTNRGPLPFNIAAGPSQRQVTRRSRSHPRCEYPLDVLWTGQVTACFRER